MNAIAILICSNLFCPTPDPPLFGVKCDDGNIYIPSLSRATK